MSVILDVFLGLGAVYTTMLVVLAGLWEVTWLLAVTVYTFSLAFLPFVVFIEIVIFAMYGSKLKRYGLNRLYMNPTNRHKEEVSSYNSLWVLLFAPIYFTLKGVWRHAIIWLVLSPSLISLVVYPFYTRSIIETHYGRMGWVKVGADDGLQHRRAVHDLKVFINRLLGFIVLLFVVVVIVIAVLRRA